MRHTPAPVLEGDPDCDVGIIHFGSTRFAVEEARDVLAKAGVATRALRVRALPLHDEVVEFVQSCRVVYVVEQNRDGQMADILRLKVPGSAGIIKKVLYYAGMPLAAAPVIEQITADQREPSHV